MTWLHIRIAIICVGFVASLFVPASQYEQLNTLPTPILLFLVVSAVVGLAFLPVMLLFVIGIQAVNPMSDDKWSLPTHHSNPFRLGNPLLFFHFAAYLFFAFGLGLVIASIWQGAFALIQGLLTFAAAFMLLVGVRLCIRVYSQKVERDVA